MSSRDGDSAGGNAGGSGDLADLAQVAELGFDGEFALAFDNPMRGEEVAGIAIARGDELARDGLNRDRHGPPRRHAGSATAWLARRSTS